MADVLNSTLASESAFKAFGSGEKAHENISGMESQDTVAKK